MKKEKKDIPKQVIIISVTLLIMLTCGFLLVSSPFISKRLMGNIISLNSDVKTDNTGVILSNKLVYDYSEENEVEIPVKVYNGSDDDITLEGYFAIDDCMVFDENGNYDNTCQISNYISLKNPIKVKQNEEYTYNIPLQAGMGIAYIGFKYNLNNQEYITSSLTLGYGNEYYLISPIEYKKNYYWTYKNSTYEKQENIFHIAEKGKCDETSNKLEVKLSKKLHLDISEDLYDLNTECMPNQPNPDWCVTYMNNYFKAEYMFSFDKNTYFPFVQYGESTSKNMFGKTNYSNIDNYFTLGNSISSIKNFYEQKLNQLFTDEEFKKLFNYNKNTGVTNLFVGKPTGIYTDVKVIPGLYFEVTGMDNNVKVSSTDEYFELCSEAPYFNLTTYDKSVVKVAYDDLINRLRNITTDEIEPYKMINITYKVSGLKSNIENLYNSRDVYNKFDESNYSTIEDVDINQGEINDYVEQINNINLDESSIADYSRITKIDEEMTSEKRSLYTDASVKKLDEALNKVKYDIIIRYQKKVDIMSDAVEEAYKNLVLKSDSNNENTTKPTTVKTTKNNNKVTTSTTKKTTISEITTSNSIKINDDIKKEEISPVENFFNEKKKHNDSNKINTNLMYFGFGFLLLAIIMLIGYYSYKKHYKNK